MVEFRPFRNTDPPHLVAIWDSCSLGRGAAGFLSPEAFEHINFHNPYFDPNGLIVAIDHDRIVGFAHAGFAASEDGSKLDRNVGVICAVLVRPQYRRHGFGRKLVEHAEAYLRAAGASTIFAGPAPPHDPFYVGLYGGVQPAGFLESDPEAVPFFEKLGYRPERQIAVFQKNLATTSEPVNFQLMTLRRKSQLAVDQRPLRRPWWWHCRFGQLDTLRFALVDKPTEKPVGSLTVVGLDFYQAKWQQRGVGLIDFNVSPEHRKEGYGQALIVEVARRLRQEMITLIEAHAPIDDAAAITILETAGLERVDTGTVLRKAD